jgi:lipopolysaccharide/colanic/teichoic acid biosynthesis glycosyltransferase
MARKFFPSHATGAGPDRSPAGRPGDPLDESAFLRALALERKRSERSGRRFLLMLIDFTSAGEALDAERLRARTIATIVPRIRETDVAGWYTTNEVLGVLFTELGTADERSALRIVRARLTAALDAALTPHERGSLGLAFHWFPDEGLAEPAERPKIITMYPDLTERDAAERVSRVVKRGIDLVVSATALVLLSPCFLAIAVAIRLSSPGPILFRQPRVGRYGVPFTFLKFRSMHAHSDSEPHRQFVKRYIEGAASTPASGATGHRPYKLTDDPRVTRLGRWLRRSSLDELPQFLNVLRGEMSLVGPRPPIPYEIEAYDVWHRRRLMEVRPGITGLWQVKGRSRVSFDDMVRLDLDYARRWSLGLDLKILLQTPRAVLFGDGAY